MTASRAIRKRVLGSARKNEGRISHIPGNGNVGNAATHPPKPPRNHTSGSDLSSLTFPGKNSDKPSASPVSARAATPPKQGRKQFPHRVAIHLRQPRNKPPSIEGAATTGAVRKERRQAPASALRAYRRWSPILSERRPSVVGLSNMFFGERIFRSLSCHVASSDLSSSGTSAAGQSMTAQPYLHHPLPQSVPQHRGPPAKPHRQNRETQQVVTLRVTSENSTVVGRKRSLDAVSNNFVLDMPRLRVPHCQRISQPRNACSTWVITGAVPSAGRSTPITSNLTRPPRCSGCRLSHCSANRTIRRCLRASTASTGCPFADPERVFTSTNTIQSPSRAIRSISPRTERWLRARMW
jgi:hypothetical protein